MPVDITTAALVGAVAGGAAVLALAFLRKAPKCGNCGAQLPRFRKPANFGQAMLGGYICPSCGADLDGRGRVRKAD